MYSKYIFILLFGWVGLVCAEDQSAGKYASVYADRTMTKLDKDGDGYADEIEVGSQWRRLKKLDADEDGKLSKQEIESLPIRYLESKGERKLNILYKKTKEEDLYLDIYYPPGKTDEPLPVIFYTHGGGWSTGSKQGIFPNVYLGLLDNGFCAVAINYRRYTNGGTVAIRDCVTDAKDAIRYIAKNSTTYQVDPEQCFVHGDSAGGQMAQMLLLSSPESLPGDPALVGVPYRMVAGVSWYGPCDFEKENLFNHDDRPNFKDRFGPRILKPGSKDEDKLKLYREMSPVQYLSKESPPLLMIQGDSDTTIPVKHAHYMEEKAREMGASVKIQIVKNAGHNWREATEGTAIEPSRKEIESQTVEFLSSFLSPK